MSDQVSFEESGGVAVVTLNNPDMRNSLSDPTMIAQLVGAIDRLNRSAGIRAAILTGAGSAFSSGGNLSKMLEMAGERSKAPMNSPPYYKHGIQLIPQAFERLDVPIIAAINGPAIGGGLDLACMCDIRIAAEGARFASNFVKLGLISGDGGAMLLPRVVGYAKACELAFTGDVFGTTEALAMGLVSRVVPAEALMPAARELARRIAENPGPALRMTKRLMADARHARMDEHLATASFMQSLAHSTPEHREALSAFAEKRKPDFGF